ncbi:MAG: ParB N-terminal domain-containing protein, partial [Oscillospiraceae bacterium]|nr:ParB N-terminal domain-containing protein [Oscillospiraceae bacterium]
MAKTMLSNLAAIAQNTASSNIRMIDIDELHPSPGNFFEVRDIPEFASTILGQGGVKDNLLVTPLESGGYEIISGHRRTAAVRYLLDKGKAISRLLPCLVQNYENGADKQLDLILCNVATRQISDQELWRSYEELDSLLKERKEAGEKFGSIRDYLAGLLHVSAAQVSKMQNVTHNAIEPVKEAVANGEISIHTANEIAKLPEQQQEELAAGDLSEVSPKDVKKKKVATSSNFSEDAADQSDLTDSQELDGQFTCTDAVEQEESTDANSNLSIELDAREAALLSMTLTGYLSDCAESDSVKDELRGIIRKLEAVI